VETWPEPRIVPADEPKWSLHPLTESSLNPMLENRKSPRRKMVLPVKCPLCGAPSGQDCRFSTTGESRDGTHRLRKLDARQMLGRAQL
jgi:hypothetical protein